MATRSQRPDRRGFDKLMYEQHVERIKSMKGTVDNKPPRPHPLSNKSEIDKRRKFAAIEFDNRLLLERLAKIVQKKTIDNEVHDFIKQQKSFKAKLSETKKKLEAQKITEENRRLLQRIQEVPPVYNHIDWEVEAKERENTIRHMLLYPEQYEKRAEETRFTKKLTSLPPSSSSGALGSSASNDQFRHMMRSMGSSYNRNSTGGERITAQRSSTAPQSYTETSTAFPNGYSSKLK